MLDEDDDFEEIPKEINVQETIEKLSQYSVTKLCDIIICDRYLGFNHDLAIACMVELGKRRSDGDDFNFEDYIEKEYQNLPKIETESLDLRSILTQTISAVKL
jgi:hypothetical protein